MTFELGLHGRKAVVIGASEGIGRDIALELARAGVHLVLTARSGDKLEALKAEIAGFAPAVSVTLVVLDLSLPGAAEQVMDAAGPHDILVNNAGAIPRGRLDEIDEEMWRRAWDLKVFGYINLSRIAYARMKAAGKGVILNILGNSGERVDAGYICGSVGNAALMAFTRALGGVSHRDGIRVLAINPGPVATERLVRLSRKEAGDRLGDAGRWHEFYKDFPFGRPATEPEIGKTAVFLVSDLSAYTTGTVVTIDGGMSHAGSLI